MNEKEEDLTTNYTTATMSGDAEAGFLAESEDTAADVSNIEALDAGEEHVSGRFQILNFVSLMFALSSFNNF